MEQTNTPTNVVAPYPVTAIIPRPEQSSRWLAFATLCFFLPKLIMTVPHLVVLYALGILAFICGVFGQFAVLFTGRYPQGLFEIVAGVMRWQLRVNAYMAGLSDIYPPFRLQ